MTPTFNLGFIIGNKKEKAFVNATLWAIEHNIMGNNQKPVYPVRFFSKTGKLQNQVKNAPHELSRYWLRSKAVMEITSGKSADQLFQKIAQQKAIMTFWAILAQRGNLNLDLNLESAWLQKFSGFDVGASFFFVFMLYTRTKLKAPVLHDMHAAGC